MNGCWRTQEEINKNICTCPQYDPTSVKCLSELDTVSRDDGVPMCPRNPKAVSREQWETDYKFRSNFNVVPIMAKKEDERSREKLYKESLTGQEEDRKE